MLVEPLVMASDLVPGGFFGGERRESSKMSEVDDGTRGEVGVVVSAVEQGAGRVRLIFDDVVAEGRPLPQNWRPVVLFTWNEYDESALSEMSLSTDEFAAIGEMVVARLQALRKRVP